MGMAIISLHGINIMSKQPLEQSFNLHKGVVHFISNIVGDWGSKLIRNEDRRGNRDYED